MNIMTKKLFAFMALSFCSFNLTVVASDISDIKEFNEQFDQYAASRPELQTAVKDVKEDQHYYTTAMNPSYLEESIKCFGLNNWYLSRLDETCAPYHQWAQNVTAEERNHPIALCVKETLLAINKLSGNLYGDVKEAKAFMPFLESIQASLAMLPGLEYNINQVINKK